METLSVKIAGEIALSDSPGSTMKKWREIFGVTQAELAEYLKISASTISDYEADRRKSPGIAVVRRFIESLLKIDSDKGGVITAKFTQPVNFADFFETHEFATSITMLDFAKLIKAEPVVHEDMLAEKKVYGYTMIDSIKVILDLPHSEFPKLYGRINERAFIFTQVSTGRSPMVVIRVLPTKPSMVVLHGLKEVDKLAIKIAQREQIPLLTTAMSVEKMGEELKKL
ncbi:MAG: helix-turn-helix domain-containing protein [Candidatus Micrarchaeota archaeon]